MKIETEQYKEMVHRELNKILSHSMFKGARRSSSFLQYVCEKTLNGEEYNIKEFSIAVDAFGLEMTFDQQNDPRIRVEAKRLRDRLKQYYDGPGCSDPVKICMIKGSYIPCFEFEDDETTEEKPPGKVENSEIEQSIILDQRFLILLDIQWSENKKYNGMNQYLESFIKHLFRLGQTDMETLSLTELLRIQKEACPFILTIRHYTESDVIRIILRLKLKQSGLLIRNREVSFNLSDLQIENQTESAGFREAEDLLDFCRSVKS